MEIPFLGKNTFTNKYLSFAFTLLYLNCTLRFNFLSVLNSRVFENMFQRNFYCCFWFTLVLHEVYMRFSTSICMKSRSTFPGKYFSFPFHVQNNMKCQQSSETRLQTVLQISDPCLKDEWPFKVRKRH